MVAYAPKQDSLGDRDNIYLNLGAGYGIPTTPVTLTAGIGYNDGSLGLIPPDGPSGDCSVGTSFATGPLPLSRKYINPAVPNTRVTWTDTLTAPPTLVQRQGSL